MQHARYRHGAATIMPFARPHQCNAHTDAKSTKSDHFMCVLALLRVTSPNDDVCPRSLTTHGVTFVGDRAPSGSAPPGTSAVSKASRSAALVRWLHRREFALPHTQSDPRKHGERGSGAKRELRTECIPQPAGQ